MTDFNKFMGEAGLRDSYNNLSHIVEQEKPVTPPAAETPAPVSSLYKLSTAPEDQPTHPSFWRG